MKLLRIFLPILGISALFSACTRTPITGAKLTSPLAPTFQQTAGDPAAGSDAQKRVEGHGHPAINTHDPDAHKVASATSGAPISNGIKPLPVMTASPTSIYTPDRNAQQGGPNALSFGSAAMQAPTTKH